MTQNRHLTVDEEREMHAFCQYIREWNLEYRDTCGHSRRVFVLTFGCQQNEADSEKLLGMALSMGYEKMEEPAMTDPATGEEIIADLILVNTCAIREHAEKKALSNIGQYKHLKARHPGTMIGVCGCMVSQEHRCEEIRRRYPYVDFVLGTASLHRIPQMLVQRMEKQKRQFYPTETDSLVVEGLPIERESTHQAWVSIMYGCNNFCSYCIVPYVRGRERSRDPEAIYREVENLVRAGYKDITLLGQNVNSYGKDLESKVGFAELLRRLDGIEGDYLLRFMTSHPKDATKDLVDVMAEGRHIARQFHLPLQSGNDKVLREMNRHYTLEQYRAVLDDIREKMPDAAVSTDIIVGFPGETEEEFGDTLDFLSYARFDSIFSFLYSPRSGTPAAKREDQIPEEIKSERFGRLLELQARISLEKNKPLEKKTLRVLCDGKSKNNEDICSGRTEGNKIVFFDALPSDRGQFVWVRIDRADTFALYGTIDRNYGKTGE